VSAAFDGRGAVSSDPFADFYEAGYTGADPEEGAKYARWRALGARSKAGHAATLCGRAALRPERVVEVGCGDGALLAELSARGIGRRFDGFELSNRAIEIARDRGIPGAGRLEAYDGRHVPAEASAYDLAVLSHVLEHVPEPLPVLAEAARLAPWVLVEVPLEDNRSASRSHIRAEAARIGHIQFFGRRDIASLCADAGLRIVCDLSDPLPYRHHAFFAGTPRARAVAAAKWSVRAAAWRASPRHAERVFTVHYAVLATQA
jgi:SAM-dependent methyltransferase